MDKPQNKLVPNDARYFRNRFDFYFGLNQGYFSLIRTSVFNHIARYAHKNRRTANFIDMGTNQAFSRRSHKKTP